jgi:hypothetical protein
MLHLALPQMASSVVALSTYAIAKLLGATMPSLQQRVSGREWKRDDVGCAGKGTLQRAPSRRRTCGGCTCTQLNEQSAKKRIRIAAAAAAAQLVDLLVSQVDAKLLQAVVREILVAKDVQYPNFERISGDSGGGAADHDGPGRVSQGNLAARCFALLRCRAHRFVDARSGEPGGSA